MRAGGSLIAVSALVASIFAVPMPVLAGDGTGSLAFTADRDGNQEIFGLDLASGFEVNLTNHPADEYRASWSPFGARIAFVSDRAGVPTLNVDNPAGSMPVEVFEYENLDWSWSPDGNRIAWVHHEGAKDLWVIDLDSGSRVKLTHGSLETSGPSWSPDGRFILFDAVVDDGFRDVFRIAPEGGSPFNLTDNQTANDGQAQWSPDGSLIAYVENASLFVVSPAGTERRMLAEFDAGVSGCASGIGAVAWSPDSARLAYATIVNCGGSSQTYTFFVIDAFGGNPRPLAITASGGGLAWSPAADRIALTIDGPIQQRTRSVILVDPDGQNPVNLTALVGTGMTYSPSWAPDGGQVAFVADPRDSQPATPPLEIETDIYIVNSDGTKPVKAVAEAGDPVWKPLPRRGVGLVDTARGLWHLEGVTAFYFGIPGDAPVIGDWDGDGLETPGMFRPSTGFAYLRNSLGTGVADVSFFFGVAGDIPLAGDWDGDGYDSLGIYRPGIGKVFLRNTLDTGFADVEYYFGIPGDLPFVGDYDGDGIDEVGLYRPSSGFTYLLLEHGTGVADIEFFFGARSDRAIAGDWDGDGRDSVGVFRPGDQKFYLRDQNSQGFADYEFWMGQADWLPVAGWSIDR